MTYNALMNKHMTVTPPPPDYKYCTCLTCHVVYPLNHIPCGAGFRTSAFSGFSLPNKGSSSSELIANKLEDFFVFKTWLCCIQISYRVAASSMEPRKHKRLLQNEKEKVKIIMFCMSIKF